MTAAGGTTSATWEVLDAAPDAMLVVDAQGVIRFVNTQTEQMFGYARSELVGAPLTTLLPERLRVRHEPHLARYFASPTVRPMGPGLQLVAQRRNGEEFPVEIALSPVEHDGVSMAIAAVRDVSASKLAEEALRQSREDLAITLESIGDGVMVTDLQGRVVRMNRVAEVLTGWPAEQAIGCDIDDVFRIISELTRAPASSPVPRVLRDGKVVGLANHTLLIARDGSERTIADSCAPIRAANGELRGAVLVFRDNTAEAAEQRSLRETVRMQASLDCAPITIVRLDANARITHVNEAWHRFARENGANSETILGVGLDYLTAARSVCAEGAEAVSEALAEILAGRLDSFSCTYPCHSPTEVRWFRLDTQRIAADQGVVLLHTNITVQYLAEARLRVQSSVARALTERAPLLDACRTIVQATCAGLGWDFAAIWTPSDGDRLLCTETWAKPGLDAAAFESASRTREPKRGQGLLGRVWANRAPEWLDTLDVGANSMRAPAANSIGFRTGFAVPLGADGEVFAVLEFCSCLQREPDLALLELLTTSGSQLGAQVLQHRAEAALAVAVRQTQAAQAYLRSILDNIPDFVMVVDPTGTIQFINRVLPQYTMEQVVGSSWLSYNPPEQHARVTALLAQVFATGEPGTCEVTTPAPDGSPRWFSTHVGPVRYGTDDITGAVVIGRDITELKHGAAQLIASDRMASVGLLAAGMAHEINNPLTAVVGNLELAFREASELTQRLGLSADLVDELNDAREGAERIRSIVLDLKVFSRTEEDVHGPVDTAHALESTLRMASNEIRHRARIVRHYGQVPPVEANEARLVQVFLNLVMNAAQAIPEGRSDVHEIRVSTRLDTRGEVIVEIADTGSGMTPEVQARLFTPFFTTKPIGVGTGLGLAICHRIITASGGRIEVQSEVGKGSVFRVFLPQAKTAFAPAATPLASTPRAQRRGRILAIDDEPMLGTVIRRALSLDHDVVTVTDATQALARFSAGERYDIILCDLMMPDVTGMDLYATLSQSAPDQAERMIFMTGGAFTIRAREFLDQVPNQHVAKPFEMQQLRALVNERIR